MTKPVSDRPIVHDTTTAADTAARPSALDIPPAKMPLVDQPAREINGPKGPEPTRYGDWERKGRCVDF